jgi:uncharacterized membrane protein HdeD (DUF308 family)
MSRFRKISTIISGLLMIGAAILILSRPRDAYVYILLIMSVLLSVRGIADLIYYFTMARFMVGGRFALIKGVILLDFGILTGTLTSAHRFYVLIYLVIINAFSGLVELLRALEARRYKDRNWRFKMLHAVVNLGMAAGCIIFMGRPRIAVVIFCLGIIYSGIMRILSAFRRTEMVFIQ